MIKCKRGHDGLTRSVTSVANDPTMCLRWWYCKQCDRRWQTIECSLTEDDLTKAYGMASKKRKAAA